MRPGYARHLFPQAREVHPRSARALRRENAAKTVQLMMEYDPAPPFDVGTPEKAERAMIENAQRMLNAPAESSVMIDRQKEWGFPLERNFPSTASV